MTQYKNLNKKLSNSQLNKLKSGIKNGTEATSKISSNISGDSNYENNFLHKLLLTNTQVSKLRKAFANNFCSKSDNINKSDNMNIIKNSVTEDRTNSRIFR